MLFFLRKSIRRSGISVLMLILISAVTVADTGDRLIINKSIVNLRAEPSLTGEVLQRLAQGKEVIEIDRINEWVAIASKRGDARAGWIHASLLEPVNMEADLERLAFDEFKIELDRLIDSVSPSPALYPFSAVEHLQHGSIRMKANNNWFTLQQAEREKLLADVFSLWRQRVKTGYSVMVEVVDSKNERHMMIFK